MRTIRKRKDRKFYSQQKRVLGEFSLVEIIDYLNANYGREKVMAKVVERDIKKELKL